MLTQYGKKSFGEEENVSGSREQKKLQRTGNSGWLVCAAVKIAVTCR